MNYYDADAEVAAVLALLCVFGICAALVVGWIGERPDSDEEPVADERHLERGWTL